MKSIPGKISENSRILHFTEKIAPLYSSIFKEKKHQSLGQEAVADTCKQH